MFRLYVERSNLQHGVNVAALVFEWRGRAWGLYLVLVGAALACNPPQACCSQALVIVPATRPSKRHAPSVAQTTKGEPPGAAFAQGEAALGVFRAAPRTWAAELGQRGAGQR